MDSCIRIIYYYIFTLLIQGLCISLNILYVIKHLCIYIPLKSNVFRRKYIISRSRTGSIKEKSIRKTSVCFGDSPLCDIDMLERLMNADSYLEEEQQHMRKFRFHNIKDFSERYWNNILI